MDRFCRVVLHAMRLKKHHQRHWLFQKSILLQIVHFDQSNSGGVVYAAHNRGVVPRCQVAIIADSLGSVGAWPLFWMALT